MLFFSPTNSPLPPDSPVSCGGKLFLRLLLSFSFASFILTPAAADSSDEEYGWIREMTVKVQEYRALYEQARTAYESLRDSYEILQEEYQTVRRQVELYQKNVENYEWFLQNEKQAWQSLYQPHPLEKPSDSATATAEDPTPWFLNIENFDSTEYSLSGESLWSRMRHRYDRYRTRYEAFQQASQTLQEGKNLLEEEIRQQSETLNRLRQMADDPYHQWTAEREAWQRLYRE